MIKRYLQFFATVIIVLPSYLFTQAPIGLIGGRDETNIDYAALIPSDSLAPLPISSLLPAGGGHPITSVKINQLGQGLIGGKINPAPAAYVAFIAPGSTTPMPITNLPTGNANCFVTSVALNDFGQGLIGGADFNTPYAAWVVYGSSTAIPIPSSSFPAGGGLINGTGLNRSGEGLIAGSTNNFNDIYAARLNFDSTTLIPITGLPTGGGSQVFAAGFNELGQGLIGGIASGNAYAALLASGATTSIPITGLPTGGGSTIGNSDLGGELGGGQGVALNNFGQGLIVGNDNANAYAAWVSFDSPTPTPITPLPIGGNSRILAAALNDYGPALIGGQDNSTGSNAYAAWVFPGSTIPIPITGLPTGGSSAIYSVALNQFGQGLIGGNDNANAYAALLAPGSTTPIPLTGLPVGGGSVIYSASLILQSLLPTSSLTGNNLIFANYINQNAPQDAFYLVPSFFNNTYTNALESAAPTRNAISLFAADQNVLFLNHGLSLHLQNRRHFQSRVQEKQVDSTVSSLFSSLELAEDDSADEEMTLQSAPDVQESPVLPVERQNGVWFEMINATASQNEQSQTPGFDPWTTGFLVGWDKKMSENSLAGLGAAYTATHVKEHRYFGSSSIHQEYLFGYATWANHPFYFDGALWASAFQTHQVRLIDITGFHFQSSSTPHGWQLSPHAEFGYEHYWFGKEITYLLNPFTTLDWVNAWQGSYIETGPSPFNAGQHSHYSSLLRSEIGLRAYQTFTLQAWRFTLEEKGSYVNATPFQVGSVTAFLVGSPGSFTVETLSSSQNLGAAEIAAIFEPIDRSYPYGSLTYQGEFSPSYRSHQVNLEISWDF